METHQLTSWDQKFVEMKKILKNLEVAIDKKYGSSSISSKIGEDKFNNKQPNFGNNEASSFGKFTTLEINQGHPTKNLEKEKDMEIPMFDGANPRFWVKQCGKFFRLNNISDYDKSEVASNYMVGEAKIWVSQWKNSKMWDWIYFVYCLVGRFTPESDSETAKCEAELEKTKYEVKIIPTVNNANEKYIAYNVDDLQIQNEGSNMGPPGLEKILQG